MNFVEAKRQAKGIIHDLEAVAERSVRNTLSDAQGNFRRSLGVTAESIDTESFIVGAVGVFNTGKSMLLNALLHRKILNTHILPETAAITTLKYGDHDSAVVKYWNRDEWNAIEEQGNTEDRDGALSEISKMAAEMKKWLGDDFDRFITAQGRVDQNVPFDLLGKHTAANSKESVALLVREVEIRTPLEFCKDNVTIVDTPGMNDPIRLREVITQEKFLPLCDMLLWFLPAKMAFTDYDKKFLLKQLKKGNIHRLFVLVNQIDSLDGPEDVELVVNWAQKQVRQTFDEHYAANKDTERKDPPEIFAVSGKQSLLNRAGGPPNPIVTDEESGVPLFEARLRKFLFEGERAQEMIAVWGGRLQALVAEELDLIEKRLSGIDTPVKDLEAELEEQQAAANEENKKLEKALELAGDKIRDFGRSYDAQVALLTKSIPLLDRRIDHRAMDFLEEFLNRGAWAILTDMKDWSRREFEPFLKTVLTEEVDREIERTMTEIESLLEGALKEIAEVWRRLADEMKIDLGDLGGPKLGGLLGKAALGVGIGLGMRQMLVMTLGGLGAYLAGILAGPIGWVVVGVAAIWSVLTSARKLKEDARAEVQRQIPKMLRTALDKVVTRIEPEFIRVKQELMAQLKEIAEAPAREIEARLNGRLASLQELINEKNSKEFERDRLKAALETEKADFEAMRARIATLKVEAAS